MSNREFAVINNAKENQNFWKDLALGFAMILALPISVLTALEIIFLHTVR
jgi:K+-transporting ATPase A subunit